MDLIRGQVDGFCRGIVVRRFVHVPSGRARGGKAYLSSVEKKQYSPEAGMRPSASVMFLNTRTVKAHVTKEMPRRTTTFPSLVPGSTDRVTRMGDVPPMLSGRGIRGWDEERNPKSCPGLFSGDFRLSEAAPGVLMVGFASSSTSSRSLSSKKS